MDFITEAAIVALIMILALLIIPLLIGAGIAFLVGAVGSKFFGIVVLVELIFWLVFIWF